jgi:hypothetical protein
MRPVPIIWNVRDLQRVRFTATQKTEITVRHHEPKEFDIAAVKKVWPCQLRFAADSLDSPEFTDSVA